MNNSQRKIEKTTVSAPGGSKQSYSRNVKNESGAQRATPRNVSSSSSSKDIYISRQPAPKAPVKKPASAPTGTVRYSKKKKKTGKKLITFLCVLIVILIAGLGFAYWYTNNILQGIEIDNSVETDDDGNDFSKIYDEDLSFSNISDVTNLSSYQGYVLEWSGNGGQKIDSKNVTNVLLVGEDGDATETTTGRSDCIMIVSVDRKNKKIVMNSIMRDSYCCYDSDEEGRKYGKINGSCFYAGYGGLIDTVEKFYKIDIDYYISVNFDSFPQLINALGGVTVPIQEYEAEYIRRTTVHKTVQSGDAVKLDGWEALVFCRIRHSDADSDVSRTRRQRTVIKSIIESATNATNGQLLNAIKQTAPYIKTNMNKKTMIAFGSAALKNDWVHYDMQQYIYPITYSQDKEIPEEDYTGIDATIRGESCWAIDYPKSAMAMQKNIYGITNITLDSVRPSLEELKNYAENYYEFY